MANYNYYLGPWLWVSGSEDLGDHWSAPAGTVGLVDLRGLPDCALAGTAGSKPFGFFAVTGTLGAEFDLLGTGDLREISATTAMRDTWAALLGHTPAGDKLLDLLWDQLTAASDPTFNNPTPPLMPTISGSLNLLLGGHSLIKSERFVYGTHPHTGKVTDVLRRNFRTAFDDGRGSDHARRVLDFNLEKYRISKGDWQQLVPPDLRRHIPGPLPHNTTISDDFTRADGDTIGNQLSWTETVGDIDTVSNEVYSVEGGDGAFARAESDLSGDDHYSQFDMTSEGSGSANTRWSWAGATARHSTSADTAYIGVLRESQSGSYASAIFKRVTGTNTSLASTDGPAGLSFPETIKLECNGSAIELFRNGGSVNSVTDSAISGNTRCGINLRKHASPAVGPKGDDFEAADLAVGGAVPTKSILRGAYKGIRLGMAH